jgi:O-antigen/teichoic acid export membrane protein
MKLGLSRVTLAGGGVLLTNGLATGGAFLLQLFLSNTLQVENYGVYALVMTWVTLLVFVSKLGLDSASLKWVAIYSSREEYGSLRAFMRFTTRMTLLASVVACVLAALAGLVFDVADRVPITAAILGLLAVPMLALVELLSSRLAALQHPSLAQLINGLGRPLVVVGVITLIAVQGSPDANHAVGANLLACVLALGLMYAAVHRIVPGEPVTTGTAPVHEWYAVAWPMYLIALSQFLLARADVLVVGAMLSSADVAVYFVANQLATLVTFGITAVNSVTAPLIARCHNSGDRRGLQQGLRDGGRLVMLYTLPVCGVLIVGGDWLLGLFGPEFSRAYIPLLVLSAGQFVIAYCGPVGFLLTMTDYQRTALGVVAILAVVQVLLATAFASKWGIVGVACAAALCNAVRSIVLASIVSRKLGVSPRVL